MLCKTTVIKINTLQTSINNSEISVIQLNITIDQYVRSQDLLKDYIVYI